MPRLLNHSNLALVFLGFFAGVFLSALLPPGEPLLQLPSAPQPVLLANSTSVETVFSPGAASSVLAEVSSAQSTLDVQLYQFSYADLKNALAKAALRGVRVRIILEPRVESNLETAQFLKQNGVSARWASREYTNTHSKTMVADARRVLVGSINWSRNAMKTNREAGVVIESEELAREFLRVFEEDWAKATDVVAG